jgi:hypothetical protein
VYTVITVFFNVDVWYECYYDVSGALVAVTSFGPVGAEQCAGGSAGFAIPPKPTCTQLGPVPACTSGDGGTAG